MFEFLSADLRRFEENEFQSSIRARIAGVLSPGFQAIALYRFFNWCHRRGVPTQPFRYVLERIVEITTGISIPAHCSIGKGFRIHHFGGVIFHSSVVIGDFGTVYHEVTIGDRGGEGRAARIGSHVRIGAGAKVVGEITIGDHCTIGANAVVTKDMPDNTTAYGNPAIYRTKRQGQEDADREPF